jgi:hypothetical protein
MPTIPATSEAPGIPDIVHPGDGALDKVPGLWQ